MEIECGRGSRRRRCRLRVLDPDILVQRALLHIERFQTGEVEAVHEVFVVVGQQLRLLVEI